MMEDMDAGVMLRGTSLEEVREEILKTTIEVASGKRARSELLGLGDEELCPRDIGAVL